MTEANDLAEKQKTDQFAAQTPSKGIFLKQYYLGCLAHASYLIADEASGTAIVVDPQRDIQQYLDDAQQLGFNIRHVFLTHFHADFLAGHLELRDRCGADIRLGSQAKAEYTFVPMKDGDTLDLPGLRLQVLETPGHTIESISILVFDLTTDPTKPYAVLTGDTLFIGDVGRPDLRASLGWTAQQLSHHLYNSLHNKLLPLPDETLVYPAHGAGSLCGKNLSSDTVSTLGEQRRFNYALQPMSEEDFTRIVTADQPDAPAYFTFDAILNTRERPTLDTTLERVLHPIDLDEVLAMGNAGAQILDVRDASEYAKGHLAGSLNIGLGGQYATWAGTILDSTKPIVIIAEPGREQEAALRLGRIGFDHIKGYLRNGMEALAKRQDLVWSTERVSAPMLAEELSSTNPPLVIDIRTPREWSARTSRPQHQSPAVPTPASHQRSPPRPQNRSPLRRRLPLLHRGQHPQPVRHHQSHRTRRRHSSMAVSKASGHHELSDPSSHQLQIIRLIRNRPIPELPNNLRPLQKEDPLHLVSIFLDRPDPVLEDRPLQPPQPHRRLQQRQRRMHPRQGKHRHLINLRLRIAHPLHIADPVIIKERLRPLRRPQMHKHRPHTPPRQLPLQLRNIADRLPAERTPKVSQKHQQHRRSLRQRQQIRTRLRMNRGQRPRHIIRGIDQSTCHKPRPLPEGSNRPEVYMRALPLILNPTSSNQ